MPGAPDPLYVAARRTLLDALDAVREHLEAVILVGAQAVYVHTGEGDLGTPLGYRGTHERDGARQR